MTDILCPRKEVPWATTKRDILMKDFKVEARLCLNIIYSRVSPSTQITIFIDIHARIVACILYGIAQNMDEIALFEWQYFKNYGGTHPLLSSLSLNYIGERN